MVHVICLMNIYTNERIDEQIFNFLTYNTNMDTLHYFEWFCWSRRASQAGVIRSGMKHTAIMMSLN